MSSAPSGPLESLRVLVVGDYLAAPVCGQFLSRLGASVTRIESPETGTLQHRAPGAVQHQDPLVEQVSNRVSTRHRRAPPSPRTKRRADRGA